MNTTIQSLASELRDLISTSHLSGKRIQEATQRLKDGGYTYDQSKYPHLPPSAHGVTPAANQSPTTLAEALLWKLGKWNAYQRFAEFYQSGDESPRPSTSVVFDAFALHFRNRSYPIFDQHSLRAIWSICKLTQADRNH